MQSKSKKKFAKRSPDPYNLQCDIACNIIMSKSRLEEIEGELRRLDSLDSMLESLKRQTGNVRSRDLERLATSIGMTRAKKQTGEPKWKLGRHTVYIPSHPKPRGAGLGIRLCKQLQAVVFDLRSELQDEADQIKKQQSQYGKRNKYE